jgi:hypothetical protein
MHFRFSILVHWLSYPFFCPFTYVYNVIAAVSEFSEGGNMMIYSVMKLKIGDLPLEGNKIRSSFEIYKYIYQKLIKSC